MTFAWQGAAQLSYVGEYACRSFNDDEEPPRCGLLLSGWVERENALLCHSWFIRLFEEDRYMVGTNAATDSFLSRCQADGLSCWCTGISFPSPVKCFLPLSVSVYRDSRAPGGLSRYVAGQLYLSSANLFLRGLLCLPSPVQLNVSGLLPGLCHPHAYRHIQTQFEEIVSLPVHLSGALLFLLHQESSARSKTACFYGMDACRLGNSAYTFSRSAGGTKVSKDVPPAPLPCQLLRGCLVIGQTGAELFRLLTEFLKVSPAGPTLVLCRKEECPFLRRAIDAAGEPHSFVRKLSDFSRLPAEANVVALSVECLYHEDSDELSLALRGRPWRRFVCLGWPDLQDELQGLGFSVAYESKISLCLAEEINVSSMDLQTVEHMLGLEAFSLQDLSVGYFEVLKRNVYYLKSTETERAWVAKGGMPYKLLHGPAVSPLEEMGFEGLQPGKLPMHLLFGDLCSGRGLALSSRFPCLQEGETFEAHFRALNVPLGSFAQQQLTRTSTAEQECPICFEPAAPEVATSCGHFFCRPCLQNSLRVQRRCPTCRVALRRKDLVAGGGAVSDSALGEYLTFLFEELSVRRGSRLVVLASWPEHHERLTALFRRRGLRRCWAWRGSAERLETVLQDFYRSDEPGGCLFVDPDSLSWETFPDVSDALVLWPLNFDPSCLEGCCQLRKARQALPGCSLSLLLRGGGEEGGLPPPSVRVTCSMRHPLTLPCFPLGARASV